MTPQDVYYILTDQFNNKFLIRFLENARNSASLTLPKNDLDLKVTFKRLKGSYMYEVSHKDRNLLSINGQRSSATTSSAVTNRQLFAVRIYWTSVLTLNVFDSSLNWMSRILNTCFDFFQLHFPVENNDRYSKLIFRVFRSAKVR